MGNNQKTSNFRHSRIAEWSMTGRNAYAETVWNTTSGEQGQVYTVTIPGKLDKQLEIYALRNTEQYNFVRVLDIIKPETMLMCSGQETIQVVTEPIKNRLADLRNISFQQAVLFLIEITKGFRILKQYENSLTFDDTCAAVNRRGEVRIWLNGNFGSNSPPTNYFSSNSLLIQIFESIGQHIHKNHWQEWDLLGRELKIGFSNDIEEAPERILDFCQQNRYQIPNKIQNQRIIQQLAMSFGTSTKNLQNSQESNKPTKQITEQKQQVASIQIPQQTQTKQNYSNNINFTYSNRNEKLEKSQKDSQSNPPVLTNSSHQPSHDYVRMRAPTTYVIESPTRTASNDRVIQRAASGSNLRQIIIGSQPYNAILQANREKYETTGSQQSLNVSNPSQPSQQPISPMKFIKQSSNSESGSTNIAPVVPLQQKLQVVREQKLPPKIPKLKVPEKYEQNRVPSPRIPQSAMPTPKQVIKQIPIRHTESTQHRRAADSMEKASRQLTKNQPIQNHYQLQSHPQQIPRAYEQIGQQQTSQPQNPYQVQQIQRHQTQPIEKYPQINYQKQASRNNEVQPQPLFLKQLQRQQSNSQQTNIVDDKKEQQISSPAKERNVQQQEYAQYLQQQQYMQYVQQQYYMQQQYQLQQQYALQQQYVLQQQQQQYALQQQHPAPQQQHPAPQQQPIEQTFVFSTNNIPDSNSMSLTMSNDTQNRIPSPVNEIMAYANVTQQNQTSRSNGQSATKEILFKAAMRGPAIVQAVTKKEEPKEQKKTENKKEQPALNVVTTIGTSPAMNIPESSADFPIIEVVEYMPQKGVQTSKLKDARIEEPKLVNVSCQWEPPEIIQEPEPEPSFTECIREEANQTNKVSREESEMSHEMNEVVDAFNEPKKPPKKLAHKNSLLEAGLRVLYGEEGQHKYQQWLKEQQKQELKRMSLTKEQQMLMQLEIQEEMTDREITSREDVVQKIDSRQQIPETSINAKADREQSRQQSYEVSRHEIYSKQILKQPLFTKQPSNQPSKYDLSLQPPSSYKIPITQTTLQYSKEIYRGESNNSPYAQREYLKDTTVLPTISFKDYDDIEAYLLKKYPDIKNDYTKTQFKHEKKTDDYMRKYEQPIVNLSNSKTPVSHLPKMLSYEDLRMKLHEQRKL